MSSTEFIRDGDTGALGNTPPLIVQRKIGILNTRDSVIPPPRKQGPAVASNSTFLKETMEKHRQNNPIRHQDIHDTYIDHRTLHVRSEHTSVKATLPNTAAPRMKLGPSTSNVKLTLNSQQIAHKRSIPENKSDLKPQRSISRIRSIISQFSTSLSPKSTSSVVSRPAMSTATTLPRQKIVSDPDVGTYNENTKFSKRVLSGSPKEATHRRSVKRIKLDDTSDEESLTSASDDVIELDQFEPIDLDVIQPSGDLSAINVAPSVGLTPEIFAYTPKSYRNKSKPSKKRIPVIDLTSPSPEPSLVIQGDISDEIDGADFTDLENGFTSGMESFEEYDPFFDAFETPKPKPVRLSDDDLGSTTIEAPGSTSLKRNTLIELYQWYELTTDKNARKPYITKRAREFMSHLGNWNVLDQYQDEILHVDFSQEEVEVFKEHKAVPGRTTEDCARFLQDYPTMILDYDYPSFIKVNPSHPPHSASDYLSRPHSFLGQRRQSELGVRRPRADREIQRLLNLKPCSNFNHASGDVIDFKFSPISNQFAVCCNTLTNEYNRPGNLLFGNAKEETVSRLNGHVDHTVGAERYYTVSDIRFSNDGQYLYSGSYDNTVKIWDMKGEMVSCLAGHGRITALSTTLCSDRVLAVASDDGKIYLYDVLNPSKQRRAILKAPNERLCGAFLVPGQGMYTNWMLAGYEAKDNATFGALYAYDIPTGTIAQRIVPASNSQAAAYFHPNAHHFVVGATGHFLGANPTTKSIVRVFDPRREKISMEIGFDSLQKDINKVTMSPCGFRVTSSGTDGKTMLWDLRMIRHHSGDNPLHILAHGPTKMVPPVDARLEDWDMGVSVAEWLPESDYLMTGGSDGALKLWDIRLGEPFLRNIAEFDSGVSCADFNSDRDMLGVGESSGRVTFLDWHGPYGEELRKFQLQEDVVGDVGNEGIMAARELIASGRVVVREYNGLRSVFAV